MNGTYRSKKRLLVIALGALLIAGCFGGSSIFQWRIIHTNMQWMTHTENGDIYVSFKRDETVDGSQQEVSYLRHYQDSKTRWSRALPSDYLEGGHTGRVVETADGETRIVLASRSGSAVSIYSESGELLYSEQTGISSIDVDSNGNVAKATKGPDSAHVSVLTDGQWNQLVSVPGLLRQLAATDYGWVVATTTDIYSVDNSGQVNWSYTFPQGTLDSMFIGKDRLVAAVADVSELLFIDLMNGNTQSLAGDYLLLGLDGSDNPYVMAKTEADYEPILKIDVGGTTLLTTEHEYQGEPKVYHDTTGNPIISHRVVEQVSNVSHATSMIDMLDMTGNLNKRYTAQTSKVDSTLCPIPGQITCTPVVVQPGFNIFELFVDVDDDIYVRGREIVSVLGFPNERGFFGKVDLTKGE